MAGSKTHRESHSRQPPTPNFSRQRPYSPTQIRQGSVYVIDGIPPYTQQYLSSDDGTTPSPGGRKDDVPWPDEPQFSLDFDFSGSNQNHVESRPPSANQAQKPRVTVNTRCTARTIEGTPIVTFISTTSIIAPPDFVQKPLSPVADDRLRLSDNVGYRSDSRSEMSLSPNPDEYRRDLDLFPAPATYTVMDRPRPSLACCRSASDSSLSQDSFNLSRRSSAMPALSSTTSLPPTLRDANDDEKVHSRQQPDVRPSRVRSNSDISYMRGARSTGNILSMTHQPTPPPRTSSNSRTNVHPAYRKVEWSDSQEFDHSSRSFLNLQQHVERPDLQHRRHASDLGAQRRRTQEPPKGILKPSRDWDRKVCEPTSSNFEQKALQHDQAKPRGSPAVATNTTLDPLREYSPISPASSHDTSSSSFFSIYRHGRHSHSTSSNTSSDTSASSTPTTVILFDDSNNGRAADQRSEKTERITSDPNNRKGSDFNRGEFREYYGTSSQSYNHYNSGYPRVVTIRTHDDATTAADKRPSNKDEGKIEEYNPRSSNKRRSLGNMMLGHHKPHRSQDSSKSDSSTKPMIITRPSSTLALTAPPSSPVDSHSHHSNSSTSTTIRLVPPSSTSNAPSRAPNSPPVLPPIKPILSPPLSQNKSHFSTRPYNPPPKPTDAITDSSSKKSNLSKNAATNKPFTASTFDYTTLLSEKEAAKLRSRGVNPALYAEMRAMRKGKGLIGALMGNAYVS